MYDRLSSWLGRSLRRKLLLAIITTVVVVLGILGMLSFLIGQRAIRYEVEMRNAHLASLMAQTIGTEFTDRFNHVALLVTQLQRTSTFDAQAQTLRDFRLNSPTTYQGLYVVASDGSVIIDVAAELETLAGLTSTATLLPQPRTMLPVEAQQAFTEALKGKTFISPTLISQFDQVPITILAWPITDQRGQVTNVLVVKIDGRKLWRDVDDVRIGTTGRVFVASAEGFIIAHPERNYIGQPLATELRPVIAGYQGQIEYRDPVSGQLMLAAYSPVSGRSGWSIIVEQARDEALAPVNSIAFLTLVMLLFALGCATIITFAIARSITRPIQKLVQATRYITHTGDLSHDIPVVGTDEVNQLAGAFNGMMATLRTARDRLLEAQTVEQELRIAREIQTSLLPAGPPYIPGLDIAADCVPAQDVGGDFYGYYRLAVNHARSRELLVTVGDVSGKGIPAALYMAVSSSALAARVTLASNIVQLYDELNTILHPRTTQTRMNTALLTVHLDTHQQQWFAHVVNAGLIAPLHRSSSDCQYLDVGGLPLGAVLTARYDHLDVPLQCGDWLILCSDGIIEAMNEQREIYGFDRLQDHVANSPVDTAQAMVASIMHEVLAFAGKANQHDDMTVVVIRMGLTSAN